MPFNRDCLVGNKLLITIAFAFTTLLLLTATSHSKVANMTTAAVAPYGSWKSPITADSVASSSTGISEVKTDPARMTDVYWIESRPSEGGRRVLVSKKAYDYNDETLVEHTSDSQWNVRTEVHEYGGGSYEVYDGLIVFVNWSNQGLYFIDTNADNCEPIRIAEQNNKLFYASFAIHPSKKFVVCVREDHRESDIEAPATLVAVPLPQSAGTQEPTTDIVLFDSHDFVSSPTIAVNGVDIAFYAWNHPDMNWDATTLFRAKLQIPAGSDIPTGLDGLSIIAGGQDDPRESIYQPRFDETGRLHFLSDRTGFWNPYHVNPDSSTVIASYKNPIPAEFGPPEWAFGMSTLRPIPGRPGSVITAFEEDGEANLHILDVTTRTFQVLPVPGWTVLDNFAIAESRSGETILVLTAGGPTERMSLYAYFTKGYTAKSLKGNADTAKTADVEAGYISIPREIEFPTRLPPFDNESGSGNVSAYTYYYPPSNKDYVGPEGELPPLLVLSHGGPTSATHAIYNPKILYWTSRGFAVADVNYGGSTGKGRAYRERLYPHFGEVDVEDCTQAALHLAAQGLVDRNRLTIMGGSAGGFTTLASLAFRPEVFAVGASHYGISDLEVLSKESHKFEGKYPVHLVGKYPEEREKYIERSPIYSVDKLVCPAIFFQGLEDKIVPPNQAQLMVDALRKKGVKVAHVEFEGEQHGFRKAENIVRALEAQFWFFGKILGFEPADDIEPVPIYNDDA